MSAPGEAKDQVAADQRPADTQTTAARGGSKETRAMSAIEVKVPDISAISPTSRSSRSSSSR